MSHDDEESDEMILVAASAIRPRLYALLGADAGPVDELLRSYLEQARSGEKVGNLILDLMAQNEATREWIDEYLTEVGWEENVRAYRPLPGGPHNPPMQRFICPDGDFQWFRRSVGEQIPTCPFHDKQLIPG